MPFNGHSIFSTKENKNIEHTDWQVLMRIEEPNEKMECIYIYLAGLTLLFKDTKYKIPFHLPGRIENVFVCKDIL